MILFTELFEGLKIAWAAIRANKLRSVLTTLGIVIGVVTVTLMGTAIEGLDKAFLKSISFVSADVLYIQKEDWGPKSDAEWRKIQKRREITPEQEAAVERGATMARAIAPVCFSQRLITYNKRSASGVTILGTTDQLLFTGGGLTIADGRFISAAESDGGRPVCVIGTTVATNLFPREPPLGKKVAIDRHAFEVIGVLSRQGDMFGDFDNQAIIPMTQFNTVLERRTGVDMIEVKVRDTTEVEDAKEELRHIMRKARRLAPGDPDDFAINQQDQILDIVHKVIGTIAAVGLFITGLSLFVGGIGIMNIMFVSVAERTREIGIRKAIGAKRRTILMQFIIEAVTICLLGGAIGLGIAWPLTLVVQHFLPASMSLSILGLAILVSLLTGVISGFFPAWRAARMDPVDALRNE
ncbi:MAG: hypothetical protein C5B50_14050 [Verrucomicrobia bacterium]|nr:MAG: hypothetical protein C5B50_14050 [Verrucomicrobiota bacterium]